jgi:hypothetical protein
MSDLFAAKMIDSQGVNLESQAVKLPRKEATGFQTMLDQAYRSHGAKERETRDGKSEKVALLSKQLRKERSSLGELDQTASAHVRSVTVADDGAGEFGLGNVASEAVVETNPAPVKETEVEEEADLASQAVDQSALAVGAVPFTPTLIANQGAVSSQTVELAGGGQEAGQARPIVIVGEGILPALAVGATDASQPISLGPQSLMSKLPVEAALTTGSIATNAQPAENSLESQTSPPPATADQPAELIHSKPPIEASGITGPAIAANPQAAVMVTAEVAAPLTTVSLAPLALDGERTTMVTAELPETAVPGTMPQEEPMTPLMTPASGSEEGVAPAGDIPTEANRVAYNMVMAGASLQKNGLGFATGQLQQPIAESLKTQVAGAQLVLPAEVTLTKGYGRSLTSETKAPDGIKTPAVNVGSPHAAEHGSAFTGGGMAAVENQADDANATLTSGATSSGPPLNEFEFTGTGTETAQSVEDLNYLPEQDLKRQSGDLTVETPVAEGTTSPVNLLPTNRVTMNAAASAVDNGEIFAQIVDEAQVMVGQGQSEMELSLKPDHLGKLKLKIAVDHQIVTAHFTVESEQVKQIIETNLAELRKQFQDTGTQIENFTVTVGQHDGGEAGYSQQSFSGGRQDSVSDQSTGITLDRPDSEQVTPVRPPVPSTAVIDLIA